MSEIDETRRRRHVAQPTNPDARDSRGLPRSTCAYCLREVERISMLRHIGGEAVRRREWRHVRTRDTQVSQPEPSDTVAGVEYRNKLRARIESSDVYASAFADRSRYHGGLYDGIAHSHRVCVLLDFLDEALHE